MAEQDDIRRQERIEAYVGGKLAGEELRAFEAELAADAQLQRDVEVERTLSGTLRRSPELRFRDLVQRVSDEQERGATGGGGAEKPVIPIDRGRMRWWAAAAGVLVLLGVSVWMFNERVAGPDHRGLALAELQRPLSGTRGGDGGPAVADSLYLEATKLLLAGKWEQLLAYSQALLDGPDFEAAYGDRMRLDRAWALLQLDRPGEAREELVALLSTDPTIMAERAYDLALAHLLEEDAAGARRALEGVAAPFPWDERIARLQEGLTR